MANKTANVIARIEPELKQEAESILKELGIPVSTLVSMLYKQVVLTKGIPFPIAMPEAQVKSPIEPALSTDDFPELNTIWNEDCFITMKRLPQAVDVILTSPPYNTNAKAEGKRTLLTMPQTGFYPHLRYDHYSDGMSNEEYCQWTRRLFLEFDRILKSNGVVLYNLNYGGENTEGIFRAVNIILAETPFTLADVIIWKKQRALPNNVSPNRLTRITEFIFVFCRESEKKTFYCSKAISSIRRDGQTAYHNIYNFVQAPNNSEDCPYNKATYSEELCTRLLEIYAPEGGAVYDPFLGSGTTAVACLKRGLSYIGSEISAEQCEWAYDRVERTKKQHGQQ